MMRVLPDALLFASLKTGFAIGCRLQISAARAVAGPVWFRSIIERSTSCCIVCASGQITSPANLATRPPRRISLQFHLVRLWENANAALRAREVDSLRPFAGADSARPLLFSDDALSYVSLRHALFA
jgi:hypothetical protein